MSGWLSSSRLWVCQQNRLQCTLPHRTASLRFLSEFTANHRNGSQESIDVYRWISYCFQQTLWLKTFWVIIMRNSWSPWRGEFLDFLEGESPGKKKLSVIRQSMIPRKDYTSKYPEDSEVAENKVADLKHNLRALQRIFSDLHNVTKELTLLRIQSPNLRLEEGVFENETLI